MPWDHYDKWAPRAAWAVAVLIPLGSLAAKMLDWIDIYVVVGFGGFCLFALMALLISRVGRLAKRIADADKIASESGARLTRVVEALNGTMDRLTELQQFVAQIAATPPVRANLGR